MAATYFRSVSELLNTYLEWSSNCNSIQISMILMGRERVAHVLEHRIWKAFYFILLFSLLYSIYHLWNEWIFLDENLNIQIWYGSHDV